MLRRLIVKLGVAYILLCISIALFASLQAKFEPKIIATADVIVVLGGGMDKDGSLHASSILRVEKGVALFESEAAPRLLFSGGRAVAGGPSAGQRMADLAMEMGISVQVISIEHSSLSTLQNALFSMPMLKSADRIILVTEGFHLPRSWLSMKWAAWNKGQNLNISLAHSTVFRGSTGETYFRAVKLVGREGLAWVFNIGRATVWQVAGLTGIEDGQRDKWLQ